MHPHRIGHGRVSPPTMAALLFVLVIASAASARSVETGEGALVADPREGGNCNNYGSHNVNVWALGDCGDGPCDNSGSGSVNVWAFNDGCARYTWIPCRSVVVETDTRSSAGCPPDPVNWDTSDGNVDVWIGNT